MDGYPGHPEIELALVKLYRETEVQRYLDLACYFINRRGEAPDCFINERDREGWKPIFEEFKEYDPRYAQNHKPVREQETAEGHAVRAVYLYSAMADIAEETGDESLLRACHRLWDNITQKRMYITGGIGSSGYLERFTTDYDLPSDRCYCETCAAIGLALFGLRMAKITGEARFMDVVERVLYNAVIAGISLDGKSFFYVNPLEMWPPACMEHTSMAHVKPIRQKWFSVSCCPPNIARTLASLGQYIYLRNGNQFFVNLYIDNQMDDTVDGNEVSFSLKSSLLIDGKSKFTIHTEQPCTFTIGLRIPEYVRHYAFTINGVSANPVIDNGYAIFTRRWEGEVLIEVNFEILAQFVAAHPEVRANAGKVAVVKGPIVYCLEEIDNGSNLASIIVDSRETIIEEYDPSLFNGKLVLKFNGRKISASNWSSRLYQPANFVTMPITLKAIPYCLWGNRSPGEMIVWMNAVI